MCIACVTGDTVVSVHKRKRIVVVMVVMMMMMRRRWRRMVMIDKLSDDVAIFLADDGVGGRAGAKRTIHDRRWPWKGGLSTDWRQHLSFGYLGSWPGEMVEHVICARKFNSFIGFPWFPIACCGLNREYPDI